MDTMAWRKASRSNDQGGACVEVSVVSPSGWRKAGRGNEHGGACLELAGLAGGIAVRDSKDPDGAKLVLGRGDFRSLVNELKRR